MIAGLLLLHSAHVGGLGRAAAGLQSPWATRGRGCRGGGGWRGGGGGGGGGLGVHGAQSEGEARLARPSLVAAFQKVHAASRRSFPQHARPCSRWPPMYVVSVLVQLPQRVVGAGPGGSTRLDVITLGGNGSKEGGARCAVFGASQVHVGCGLGHSCAGAVRPAVRADTSVRASESVGGRAPAPPMEAAPRARSRCARASRIPHTTGHPIWGSTSHAPPPPPPLSLCRAKTEYPLAVHGRPPRKWSFSLRAAGPRARGPRGGGRRVKTGALLAVRCAPPPFAAWVTAFSSALPAPRSQKVALWLLAASKP
jgi:hypothetical protein